METENLTHPDSQHSADALTDEVVPYVLTYKGREVLDA